MLYIRPADERGITKTAKILSYHSFSFNRYYDQKYLAWSDLRVLNEDFVAPGGGFPTHAHNYQNILTWVLSGTLEHQDSLGNIHRLYENDMQMMYAGARVEHKEYNPSSDQELHFLQIWIAPNEKPEASEYHSSHIEIADYHNILRPVITSDGLNGLPIKQDIEISIGVFDTGQSVRLPQEQRYYWAQIVSGAAVFQDQDLTQGTGLHYFGETDVTLNITKADTKILFFDMQIPK
ncbi:MAG: pirin family protein [Pseudomonadota bacterium]